MPAQTLGWSSFAEHARRYFVGTAMTPCLRFMSAVILKVDGRGLNADFDLVHQLNVRTPPEVRALLEQGGAGLASGSQLPGMASRLVAELQVVNVERLLNHCGVSAEKITAIGQRGPAFGKEFWKQTGCSTSIGDPAILAEATGVTVIDHFEQRDLAKGGVARGLDTLPLWMLFTRAVDSVSTRPTVVARVDQTIELFYLPARRRNRPIPAIAYRDIGPAFSLLQQLQPLCGQSVEIDKSLDEPLQKIMQQFQLEDASLDSPQQLAVLVERIIDQIPKLVQSSSTLNQTLERTWCKHITNEIQEQFPPTPQPAELVVLGRGARREAFVKQLADRFSDVPLSTELTKGWISGASGAAIAAIFAALHIDQVGGNLPDLTGAAASRVLGRITPGNPANWRGVLSQMEVAVKQTMPLREAI